MEFNMKLPRNKKDFLLFVAIISIISINIIAPLIACFEVGFNMQVWVETKRVLPFIWICVVILVLLTHKPAGWLTSKIVDNNDSFNSTIIINTLFAVLLMSTFLTIIGSWIGNKHISMEPINLFFINGQETLLLHSR